MKGGTGTCQNCRGSFTIEPEDFAFYRKVGVLPPKICHLCRAQLRLSFRNERAFYKRKCDKCQRDVVSMYSPNKPYTVWCYDCWFADDWDAEMFGRPYNPQKPFLEQFNDLWKAVPKVALIHVRSVNSEYLNISADNKNCYLIVESSNNENCTHCYWIQECKDLVDVSFSHQTELSYESDDCYSSSKLFYSKGCHDCLESYFLLDCRGCANCLGCVNLRNKQYHVFNKPVAKEEYEDVVGEARLDTYSGVQEMRERFSRFAKTQPKKFGEVYNAVNSTGNYIKNAKNCKSCFHCYDSEDCRYGVHVWRNAKDCFDCDTAGRNAETVYNSMNSGIDVSHYVCSNLCWTCSFMDYSYYCFDSNNCFGSVGLRKKNHYVLNKRYPKDSFDKLRVEIVENMKKNGEYGGFFPAHVSTFGYNESAAYDQFPLSKEEALAKGFKWENSPRGTYGKATIKWENFPDSINDLGDFDVGREVFACVECEKNYRIIPGELKFYKYLSIPIPRLCPDCRHARRFSARGPNRLWKAKCSCGGASSDSGVYQNTSRHFHGSGPCPNEFETSYAPDRKEIVYCESCYNAEVV